MNPEGIIITHGIKLEDREQKMELHGKSNALATTTTRPLSEHCIVACVNHKTLSSIYVS